MKTYYIYIMSNATGTIYIGVTSNLHGRVWQHKTKAIDGFTKKYNINRLIYYEETNDVEAALLREKQIKSWRRTKKLALIRQSNPTFKDLSEGWYS